MDFQNINPKEKLVFVNSDELDGIGDTSLPVYSGRRWVFTEATQTVNIDGTLHTDSIKGMVIEDKVNPQNGALGNMQKYEFRDTTFHLADGITGFRLAASNKSRFVNCTFIGGATAVEMVFCMNTVFEHCMFIGQTEQSVFIRSGEGDALSDRDKYFSNANGVNAQSNNTTFNQCEFYSKEGAEYGVRSYGSNNVRYENCTFQGVTPSKAAIHHDDRGSQTVTSFTVSDGHVEYIGQGCEEGLFQVRQSGGKVFFDSVYSQFGGVPQIASIGNAEIVVRDWVYYPGGGFITDGMSRWRFENNHQLEHGHAKGEYNPLHSDCWKGEGKTPRYMTCVDGNGTTKVGWTNSFYSYVNVGDEHRGEFHLYPHSIRVFGADFLEWEKVKGRKWKAGDLVIDGAIDVRSNKKTYSLLLKD